MGFGRSPGCAAWNRFHATRPTLGPKYGPDVGRMPTEPVPPARKHGPDSLTAAVLSALAQALEDPRHDHRLDRLDERGVDRALVGPAALAQHAGSRARPVVRGLAQLRLAVRDPQPARRAVALVGQPDAAGVDEAHAADDAVVLLVRVPGHDQRRGDASERVGPALRRRDPGEHLVVAARGG